MLPSNLLITRVSGGRVYPVYAPLDSNTVNLAERLIEAFNDFVDRRKGDLAQRLKVFEDEDFDYRLVRGLSKLLERRCILQTESPLNPRDIRMMVFEEASRMRTVSLPERTQVIREIGGRLGLEPQVVEKALYSDIEDELIIRGFTPPTAEALVKHYNLSLTQTLLFKSLKMEFSASGNWTDIFRALKWLGLMYSIEEDGSGGLVISVDGPLSLFKMTYRYGTSLAKLLPQILASETWRVKADVLGRKKSRIYTFQIDSREVGELMAEAVTEDRSTFKLYDSTVEQRFARSFNSCNSGWTLRREPEPLVAGKSVLIPDFSFEKYGVKVYLEIVGFWTQEYLERKISKLNSVMDVDMLVAVNESLTCSKLRRLKGKVIFYGKDVPVKPILDYLRTREEEAVECEAKMLKQKRMELKGDIVSVEDLALAHEVSAEAVRRVASGLILEGYRRIGDYFINEAKLAEIEKKISRLSGARLPDAISIIETYGLKNSHQVLEILGYTFEWNGLDLEKSTIKKIR